MLLPAQSDSELPLIDALRRGDRYAFNEFAGRHGRWIRGLIYAQLGDVAATDDVFQTVLLRIWQQAGELRDVRSWRSWVCRLARNAAYDELRRGRREASGSEQALAPSRVAARDEMRPDLRTGEEEERGRVAAAIRGLPALYREPLVLRHLEGWSYREIGEVLGVPEATVETRLVRARRMLREALAERE
jgi:RNA polymerase sigma-70 factor (ECF subfamily)